MKSLILPLALVHALCFSQTVKEVKATSIRPLDLSVEGEQKFTKDYELFEKAMEKVSNGTAESQLSAAEKRVYTEMNELMPGYWQTLGEGCSWYCGGGPDEVKASSELKPQGTNTYAGGNVHDFSYKEAWVEGVPGYGIGEYVTYKFAGESPRITEVIVVNGYVKSEKAYRDNSRVKKLKMYVNDKPYAILNLEDKRSSQTFEFEPIGNSNRANLEALKHMPAWNLKFEILEVYKGTKYDDVAIAEIYFSGMDVH
jgi:hypothetical protein